MGYGSNQYRLIKPNTRSVISARDVDILEGVFIKDLPERLIAKLAKIGPQIDDIAKQQLLTPESTEDNWLESFYSQLNENATPEDDLALLTSDPTYSEAIKSENSLKWKEACLKEVNSLKEKKTWTLVPKTEGIRVLDGKWVLKVKDPSRNPLYKARWVARGFQQQYGIDFFETFANTVNTTAWRLILALAAYLNWEIRQYDVKSAFPNASLKEKVYIVQPKGLEDSERPNDVCLLNKALYGLKQSGREWENHLKGLLAELGLFPLKTEQSIYINKAKDLVLIAYVDDLIIISPEIAKIDYIYGQLAQKIDLKDLGDIDEFLGIKITRDRKNKTISLDQGTYIDKILSKYGQKGKLTRNTGGPIPIGAKIEPLDDTASLEDIRAFQQQIGALMYLTTKTRPDLAYSVGCLARFMANPSPLHFNLLKKVWNYLGNTPKLGLFYQSEPNSIECYTDADWGGDLGTRRSTTGYIFLFRGCPISWSSKLQKTVALSSCEAEYMALKEAIKEQHYIKALLDELSLNIAINCLDIYTDSKSAIELAKNPIYHARSKHIDIQYHFVRETSQKGLIQLKWVPTEGQLANSLTKPISNEKWTRFIEGIGLKSL